MAATRSSAARASTSQGQGRRRRTREKRRTGVVEKREKCARRKAIAEQLVTVNGGYDGREEMQGKTGVLLLNLGGPDSLEDVQPFLYVYINMHGLKYIREIDTHG